jgi:hypothetical protein
MRDAENENDPNDPLPFRSLADITARLLATDAKKDENGPSDSQPGNDDQERARQQGNYVDQRLRDLAAFERRARGYKQSR